jgi:multiple sugar transport system substrate-binding protein
LRTSPPNRDKWTGGLPTRRQALTSLTAAVAGGALVGCTSRRDDRPTVDFWAMGAEGERTAPLIDEFHATHPEVRVRVQQIPWSAAHEKLLTAFAGDSLPDVCQLVNTWIAEFVALGALEELTPRLAATPKIDRADFFPGVWQSNVVGRQVFGIPWYVDTRILFYRTDLLAAAGHNRPPVTWDEWMTAMRDLQKHAGGGANALASASPRPGGYRDSYAILLPINEFELPVILGMQAGADMLKDGGRYGNFSGARFRNAFEFYVNIFREELAPKLSNTHISNVWQEFERGAFAMYISGPWNVQEFRRRMPPAMETKWATAPLPSANDERPGASTSGGSSLVMFNPSRRKDAAWKLITFLAQPRQQVALNKCTGSLPPGEAAWAASGLLDDVKFAAFHEQLSNVRPAPPAPEWELIVTGELVKTAEVVINDRVTLAAGLESLDRKVDQILEKRRWMLSQHPTGS